MVSQQRTRSRHFCNTILNEKAAAHGYIRVIDESGEDYAFAANRFYPIARPQAVERTLLLAIGS
jgi:hypothetical protein